MRSTGGRPARAGIVGTPVRGAFAAFVAALLLAGCSGGGDVPSSAGEPEPAAATESGESGESGDESIDPEAARLAELSRRLQRTWTEDASYTFRSRVQGTFVATARGQGSVRNGLTRQLSKWRIEGNDGPLRARFAVNEATNSVLADGIPGQPPGFRELGGTFGLSLEGIFGPGVNGFTDWTRAISGFSDRITDLDLEVEGRGNKITFSLPSSVWVLVDKLPEQVGRTTDYVLSFEDQKLVRIEAVRDDSVIDVRIQHGPFEKVRLPGASYRGS